jgi:hypothetical protein
VFLIFTYLSESLIFIIFYSPQGVVGGIEVGRCSHPGDIGILSLFLQLHRISYPGHLCPPNDVPPDGLWADWINIYLLKWAGNLRRGEECFEGDLVDIIKFTCATNDYPMQSSRL